MYKYINLFDQWWSNGDVQMCKYADVQMVGREAFLMACRSISLGIEWPVN